MYSRARDLTISSGTNTTVLWESTPIFGSNISGVSLATANVTGNITISTNGYYVVTCHLPLPSASTGLRRVFFNTANFYGITSTFHASPFMSDIGLGSDMGSIVGYFNLTSANSSPANIRVTLFQNSGSAISQFGTITNLQRTPQLWIMKMS
jgi:hypothetical protein